ncbi:MAG: hypothetical protein RQ736_06245 [Thiogranum sp.]|nr:hypothetical protein [Thiogranum sp.]
MIRDIGVADAGLRIGEARRATRFGLPERAFAAERPHRAVLHETQ